VQYENHVRGQIILAPGVAGFPQPGSAAPALLPAAGSALYAAKHGGRDRVAVPPAI
jgi:GGDEF domain-containing protein